MMSLGPVSEDCGSFRGSMVARNLRHQLRQTPECGQMLPASHPVLQVTAAPRPLRSVKRGGDQTSLLYECVKAIAKAIARASEAARGGKPVGVKSLECPQ
mmetsp:Transcript_57284/g.129785  ORF Transcript_57284/g.129785 Transcript_57284/m.129785 type:complete len:100 (-) Transcript_57284:1215-1514(-)